MTTTATKTTRRTAKIAKPYTAALFRCYDKVTGVCLGYLSPSEDASKAPYQVTCDNRGEWHCTCEGNARFRRKCQHIKAACELCAIRVKQGRPACRAAALPEMSNADKEQLAIVVANMTADVTAEMVATPEPAEAAARELRNVTSHGDLVPEYRDESGAWRCFKDEQGRDVMFIGGYEELARRFIEIDTDEHRMAVLAEMRQMIADYVAAEEAREVAEAAQRKAESDRRLTSALNGNRGFSLMAK